MSKDEGTGAKSCPESVSEARDRSVHPVSFYSLISVSSYWDNVKEKQSQTFVKGSMMDFIQTNGVGKRDSSVD